VPAGNVIAPEAADGFAVDKYSRGNHRLREADLHRGHAWLCSGVDAARVVK
jgi:hypothetical protein